MNSLYLQYKKTRGSRKDGQKLDVVCVIDQDHQRSAIVVDHFRKFKGIQSVENPRHLGCNIGNKETLLINSGKKKRKLQFELEKRESKKLKNYQKLLECMNKSPQCNQPAKPEQCKSQVEEMLLLLKAGNWSSIFQNTGAMQQIVLLTKLDLKVVKLRINMIQ